MKIFFRVRLEGGIDQFISGIFQNIACNSLRNVARVTLVTRLGKKKRAGKRASFADELIHSASYLLL
jgi:hypothetical protein